MAKEWKKSDIIEDFIFYLKLYSRTAVPNAAAFVDSSNKFIS